jgi:hypothetical protein
MRCSRYEHRRDGRTYNRSSRCKESLMPNRIDVLLIDGASDHYLVPVQMLVPSVQVDGETYVRTDEARRVEDAGVYTTHRVYRVSYPNPQLLDVNDE